MGRTEVHETAHNASISHLCSKLNVEVVLQAIQEAVFFQHSLGYLCPINQLNVGKSPPQLRRNFNANDQVLRHIEVSVGIESSHSHSKGA